MNVHFISSNASLTKTYTRRADGGVEKSNYPDVYRVTSHLETVTTLAQMHAQIMAHALQGHCLIKGELTRPLVCESRAGSTDNTGVTSWVCLDIDGLPTSESVDDILLQLGIRDTSYILQWSSSQGITGDGLRCHIFLLLDKPTPAPFLKQWLKHLNLTVPLLSDALRLTRSGNAIRWALDISTCQNDKLIFIAPPILHKLRDPLRGHARYQLVQKTHEHLTLPTNLSTPATLQQLEAKRRTQLRIVAGLPIKRETHRVVGNVQVLSRPDPAILTVARVGEHFTYLNINGGDSAAYYHPNTNPDILYNFKGEANYLIRELDPDYWRQATQALKAVNEQAQVEAKSQAQAEQARQTAAAGIGACINPTGQILLTFRDRKTGIYYHGTYHEETETLNLSVARNEKQIRDFCMQFGAPIGDFVPIWDLIFDTQDTIRLDVANRTINLFTRTRYMRESTPRRILACPPAILRLISHFLGGEAQIIEHFINWLAFIIQRRAPTGTAWVLYGTEGTGKGMFMKKVLRPLLGEGITSFVNAEVLTERYNKYLRHKLLVFYDEAHITELPGSETIMAKLRSAITEPVLSIRIMQTDTFEEPNHSNHILASNKPDAILLRPNDRRWNVGRYQHEKLTLSPKDYASLDNGDELQAFYDYLYYYPLDEEAARTPLITEDRQKLIDTTLSSADEVAAALDTRAANMQFLLDQLPTDNSYMANALRMNRVEDYRAVLLALLTRTTDGACKITRDELHALFEYTVGNTPDTPNKFTKFLAHRHIHTKRIRLGERLIYGIQVTWQDADQFPHYLAEHFPTKTKGRTA